MRFPTKLHTLSDVYCVENSSSVKHNRVVHLAHISYVSVTQCYFSSVFFQPLEAHLPLRPLGGGGWLASEELKKNCTNGGGGFNKIETDLSNAFINCSHTCFFLVRDMIGQIRERTSPPYLTN